MIECVADEERGIGMDRERKASRRSEIMATAETVAQTKVLSRHGKPDGIDRIFHSGLDRVKGVQLDDTLFDAQIGAR